MHPKVDEFLARLDQWAGELAQLRTLLLATDLTEAYKWRQPCYTYGGSNVALLFNFKDNFGISFFKGALLADPAHILTRPGENSISARVLRLRQASEIAPLANTITAFVYEAIEVERAGLCVPKPAPAALQLPVELQLQLDANASLREAFAGLTPGRQRMYAIYIASAKQATTRHSRAQQHIPKILAGLGMGDCSCGLSKRMPHCDGSHRVLG